MFSEEQSKIESLFENAKDYFKAREELVTLTAVEKSSKATALILSAIIIYSFAALFILFSSLTVAYVIARITGEVYIGFASVAVFYLVIALVLRINREKFLKKRIMNIMIRSMLKSNEHE
jgi:hypothetical protein